MTRSLEISGSRRLADTPILNLVVGLALLSPASAQPHAQHWSLSVRLSSKRRLLPSWHHRWTSASENGAVPVRLPRERRLLSWPERSSPRRVSGRRMPGGLWRVLPLE